MTDVTRIMIGGTGANSEPTTPTAVTEVLGAPIAGLQSATAAARSDLLWLTDARAEVSAATLDALIAAGDRPAVSLPVDRRGRPVETLLGRVAEGDDEFVLSAILRRKVPLRHSPIVSMLVTRESVVGLAPPDPARFGVYSDVEWVTRLFSGHAGFLVPASRVRMPDARRASVPAALRMMRSRAWQMGETLREVHRALS